MGHDRFTKQNERYLSGPELKEVVENYHRLSALMEKIIGVLGVDVGRNSFVRKIKEVSLVIKYDGIEFSIYCPMSIGKDQLSYRIYAGAWNGAEEKKLSEEGILRFFRAMMPKKYDREHIYVIMDPLKGIYKLTRLYQDDGDDGRPKPPMYGFTSLKDSEHYFNGVWTDAERAINALNVKEFINYESFLQWLYLNK